MLTDNTTNIPTISSETSDLRSDADVISHLSEMSPLISTVDADAVHKRNHDAKLAPLTLSNYLSPVKPSPARRNKRKQKVEKIKNTYLAMKIQAHWRGLAARKKVAVMKKTKEDTSLQFVTNTDSSNRDYHVISPSSTEHANVENSHVTENIGLEQSLDSVVHSISNKTRVNRALRSKSDVNLRELRGQHVSVWPNLMKDSFTTLGSDHSAAWPSLESLDKDIICQWIMEKKQILIRCVTWNMQASPPPATDVVQSTLLPLNRYNAVILLVILTSMTIP